jgi:hypothetical protein
LTNPRQQVEPRFVLENQRLYSEEIGPLL